MSKAARRKGANYEREIANVFKEMGWTEAKRHLEYQSLEAEEGRDLDGTQPFAVQAKCWSKTPSITAIDEITASEDFPIPLAVLKRSQVGQEPLEVAVLHLRHFIVLVELLVENNLLPQCGWSEEEGE